MGERRLSDVLVEAELDQYTDSVQHVLFVTSLSELRRVDDARLAAIGMSKPEVRRLRKFCDKYRSHGALGKIRKMFSVHGTADTRKGSQGQGHRLGHRTVISESSLSSLKTLGGGRYSTVQQGVWTADDGQKMQVAVKCIDNSVLLVDAVNAELMKTVAILQCLDHDSLLRLYGAVVTPASTMLVMELAPLRSLAECLRDTLLQRSFPAARLHVFTLQVCSAMAFLESKHIVHGDLALKNVMVVSKAKVKVGDSCLSRILSPAAQTISKSFYTQSCAWLAPECLNTQKFTSASDIWAFGVTVWEMFSYGAQPWAGWVASKVQEAVSCGHCLEKPAACPQEHGALMTACWTLDPKSRPSFASLSSALNEIVLEQLLVPADQSIVAPSGIELLSLRADDIVTVLDKKCDVEGGLWLGVVGAGNVGYFSARGLVPYVEPSATNHKQPLAKSRSLDRKSAGAKPRVQRLTSEMISVPLDDFRHVAHIGVNGKSFGNVAFLDEGTTNSSSHSSVSSLPPPRTSQSDMYLGGHINYRLSASSTATSDSSGTLTEVDGIGCLRDTRPHPDYDGDFDDFKMPAFNDSADIGSSFMDEVFKAMGHPTNQNAAVDHSDKTPLMSDTSACIDSVFDEQTNGEETFGSNGEATHPSSPDYKEPTPTVSSLQQRRARSSQGSTSSAPALPPKQNSLSGVDLELASLQKSLTGSGYTNDSIDTRSRLTHRPFPPASLTIDLPGSCGSLQKLTAESPTTPGGTESPVDKDNKKRMKMLKLDEDCSDWLQLQFVPPRERKASGVKAMTPSEEKELDEVLGIAARVATKNARDLMIPNSPGVMSDGRGSDDERSPRSPRFHGVFNFASKFRRQTSKDKSSTDDVQLSSMSNISDEPSVEAQEAYNVLVGRGLTHSSTTAESGSNGTARKEGGIVRVRRTLHHQNAVSGDAPTRPAPRTSVSNSHIRHPQGIPGRESSADVVGGPAENDSVNPLRMLRASRGTFPPVVPARKATEQANQNGDDDGPVWSPQLPSNEVDSEAPLPLPPRKPATFMTNLNRKPRERKYPLVLGDEVSDAPSGVKDKHQDVSNAAPHRLSFMCESTDNSAQNGRSNGRPISLLRTNGRDPAKSTGHAEPTRTAKKGDYYDYTAPNSTTNGHGDSSSVLSPRYPDGSACDSASARSADSDVNTSVNSCCEADTTYEDMLECILENPDLNNFARSEQLMYDEVQKVRQDCGVKVTTEETLYALEETGWDATAATQLLQAKHGTQTVLPGDSHSADVSRSWDVCSRDTGYLTETCPDSPDVVHM